MQRVDEEGGGLKFWPFEKAIENLKAYNLFDFTMLKFVLISTAD